MAKQVECPFCGKTGVRTKEHVWAQWRRDTPAAVELLRSTNGERSPRQHSQYEKDDSGRWRTSPVAAGHGAKWLPNVTVDVCDACNNGWMSALENRTKAILGPLLFEDARSVRLSADDLRLLGTWVTKSIMAYALTRPALRNPFTVDEYRRIASGSGPIVRSRVWMFSSTASQAQVAMRIDTTLLSDDPKSPDLGALSDNTAVAYLTASGVAFFMLL